GDAVPGVTGDARRVVGLGGGDTGTERSMTMTVVRPGHHRICDGIEPDDRARVVPIDHVRQVGVIGLDTRIYDSDDSLTTRRPERPGQIRLDLGEAVLLTVATVIRGGGDMA